MAVSVGNGRQPEINVTPMIDVLLVQIIIFLVIAQFVMSLLISFNVVNTRNQFVEALWTAVNALLDPILTPIRRIMPHTGAIDFSPLVLIVLLRIFLIILAYLANLA